MDALRHDLLFWQLVHFLVVHGKRQVIEISPDEKEVWLEQDKSNEKCLIRLHRKEIDWENQLYQDLQLVGERIEHFRAQLGYNSLTVENVYVTMPPPFANWQEIIRIPEKVGRKEQTVLNSHIIGIAHEGLLLEETARLASRLQLETLHSSPWYMDDRDAEALKKEVQRVTEKRREKEQSLFMYGKPIITYLLLCTIAVMFAILEKNGGSTKMITLIEYGAKYNPLMEAGEWWRLVTAMFLHIGFLHFFMNSLALFYLGTLVEKMYGSRRFFLIYFIAGIFGSAASFAFNEQVSAGASGAIFGCFGALLYFGLIHKKLFFRTIGMNVLIVLAINLSFGFLVPVIDNGAHIGGLIGGFFAASFLHLPKHRASLLRQVSLFMLTVLTCIGLLFIGLVNEQKGSASSVQILLAQELLEEGEIEQGYAMLKEIEEKLETAEGYFLLAYAEAHLEKFEEAKNNFLRAIELRPTFHEAHYNVALIYAEFNQYEEALFHVITAIDLAPDEEPYQLLKDSLENNR